MSSVIGLLALAVISGYTLFLNPEATLLAYLTVIFAFSATIKLLTLNPTH